jgi:hypothetical protein
MKCCVVEIKTVTFKFSQYSCNRFVSLPVLTPIFRGTYTVHHAELFPENKAINNTRQTESQRSYVEDK